MRGGVLIARSAVHRPGPHGHGWLGVAAAAITVLAALRLSRRPTAHDRRSKEAPIGSAVSARVLAAYPGLTAVRLWRELRERGYAGDYTAVKRAVRELRPEPVKPYEVRFETPPGVQGRSISPASRSVRDEPGVTRIVWLFSLVLGFSRLIWARFVVHSHRGVRGDRGAAQEESPSFLLFGGSSDRCTRLGHRFEVNRPISIHALCAPPSAPTVRTTAEHAPRHALGARFSGIVLWRRRGGLSVIVCPFPPSLIPQKVPNF